MDLHSTQASLITHQSTLNELARHYPGGTAILHRLGLDFCCGGGRTLDDACRPKGLNAAEVLHALERSEVDGQGVSLHLELWDAQLLVRYIELNHHAFLRELFPTLTEQITTVVAKHGAKFPELHAIADLVDNLAESLEKHMIEEEHGTFRAVLSNASNSELHENIESHEADHVAVGGKLDQLRMLTNDFTPPDSACNTHRSVYTLLERLVDDTMQHVFLENAVLFPMLATPHQSPSTQH